MIIMQRSCAKVCNIIVAARPNITVIDIRKRRGTYTKVQILGRPGAKKKKSAFHVSPTLAYPL